MADASEDRAYDEVVTMLRRAYPRSVRKQALQEGTDASVSELRAALDRLGVEAAVEQTDDGYRFVQPADRRLPAGQDPDAAGEEDRVAPPEEEEEGSPVHVGAPRPVSDEADEEERADDAPRYAVTVAVEVSFYPEPEEGEGMDDAARREAQMVAALAVSGILEGHPELAVAMRIAGLEAFDQRRVVEMPR